MNRCVDCQHHREVITRQMSNVSFIEHRCFALCGHPHPVVGGTMDFVECSAMRLGDPCGMQGKLFEAKVIA